jgi:hypothetical protein
VVEELNAKMLNAQQVRAGETILPEFRKSVFHCQFCQAYVLQSWEQPPTIGGPLWPIWRCTCTNCRIESYWWQHPSDIRESKMIHPRQMTAPLPHPVMPDDVKREYQEAATIIGASPRGAGALLRLALERLMPHLGETGSDLNADIASLVKKGLDPKFNRRWMRCG